MINIETGDDGKMGLTPEQRDALLAQGGARPGEMGGTALQYSAEELIPDQVEEALGINEMPRDPDGVPYGELDMVEMTQQAETDKSEDLPDGRIETKNVPSLSENDDPNAAVLEFNPRMADMTAGEFTKVVAEFVESQRAASELETAQRELKALKERIEKEYNALDTTFPGDVSRIIHNVADVLDKSHIRSEQGGNDADKLKSVQGAYFSALKEQLGEVERLETKLTESASEAASKLVAWADKWRGWSKDKETSEEEPAPSQGEAQE